MNRQEARIHAAKLRKALRVWERKTAKANTVVVSYVTFDGVRYRFQTGMPAEKIGYDIESGGNVKKDIDLKAVARRWWSRLRKDR